MSRPRTVHSLPRNKCINPHTVYMRINRYPVYTCTGRPRTRTNSSARTCPPCDPRPVSPSPRIYVRVCVCMLQYACMYVNIHTYVSTHGPVSQPRSLPRRPYTSTLARTNAYDTTRFPTRMRSPARTCRTPQAFLVRASRQADRGAEGAHSPIRGGGHLRPCPLHAGEASSVSVACSRWLDRLSINHSCTYVRFH